MTHYISLLALIFVFSGCSKEPVPAVKTELAKGEQPALTLVVGAVAADGCNVYSGEIRARRETPLGFRVGGKIMERLVDVGAQVKPGQILARLDPADSTLQASAAQAQYQLAIEEVKRYRELRSKNFVSQSALDAKEAALKTISSQAGLATNQAAYTALHADHAGVIAATLAEVGQVVAAGQPVVRLAQDGEREVAISIPETQFSGLKIGAPAEVSLWSAGNDAIHLSGHLRELSPVADSASRTYAARVALNNADASVALGMTAQVRFGTRDKRGQLIVPLTAVFQEGDQAAVWVVAADHSVSLRKIKVAAYRDNGAVIASGLTAGERIVSAGVHKLNAGEKIRAIEGEFADGSAQ
ncbi:MAG: efflux RND transporter periplasmic adaptor subunit [Nitrosomonadales bacterium]|nr:efflux RND transporter periplasmic adaptor subunit [Nitrosomonadales bacterium]